jgi:hypothetical protein
MPGQRPHTPSQCADAQGLVPGQRFDLIKLDVEGEERRLLADAPSRAVLCAALCVVLELHERFEPGSEAAYADFLRGGCADAATAGAGFVHLARTGEYDLLCQRQLFAGASVAAG